MPVCGKTSKDAERDEVNRSRAPPAAPPPAYPLLGAWCARVQMREDALRRFCRTSAVGTRSAHLAFSCHSLLAPEGLGCVLFRFGVYLVLLIG